MTRRRAAPLTDEQVSMLLSVADVGWMDGAGNIRCFELWLDIVGDEAWSAYDDEGWQLYDSAFPQRNAIDRLLSVLRKHGLVQR